jgi:hypothetical protein
LPFTGANDDQLGKDVDEIYTGTEQEEDSGDLHITYPGNEDENLNLNENRNIDIFGFCSLVSF